MKKPSSTSVKQAKVSFKTEFIVILNYFFLNIFKMEILLFLCYYQHTGVFLFILAFIVHSTVIPAPILIMEVFWRMELLPVTALGKSFKALVQRSQ